MLQVSKDERTWSLLIHLSGLAGYVIPFGNIFAPLILWVMKKDQSAFIDDQGKEAVNFQISFTIYIIVAAVLVLVLVGIVLLPVLAIAGLILMIIAALRANEGTQYRYPYIMRLIK